MKKILALVLALCLIVGLCACGQKQSEETGKTDKKVITLWCIATERDANHEA